MDIDEILKAELSTIIEESERFDQNNVAKTLMKYKRSKSIKEKKNEEIGPVSTRQVSKKKHEALGAVFTTKFSKKKRNEQVGPVFTTQISKKKDEEMCRVFTTQFSVKSSYALFLDRMTSSRSFGGLQAY